MEVTSDETSASLREALADAVRQEAMNEYASAWTSAQLEQAQQGNLPTEQTQGGQTTQAPISEGEQTRNSITIENQNEPVSGRIETVGHPVALQYLLEGGKGSIENAGYFFYAIQAAFPHIGAQLQEIRNSMPTEMLGITPDAFVASNPSQLQEVRRLVEETYGEAGMSILYKMLANSTGFYPREGKALDLQIENLEPMEREASEGISEEEAEGLISLMKATAEIANERELTPEAWEEAFGEDGITETPVGSVKMGENQYLKLLKKKRGGYFGMIKPTLTNPDLVLEERDEKEGAERQSKYLFVKTFMKADGSRYVHFESVTVMKDSLEVSISSHEINEDALKKKMQHDKMLHLDNRFLNSDGRLIEPPMEGPDLVPSPNPTTSANKDTQSVSSAQADKQENSANGAESNAEVANEGAKELLSEEQQAQPKTTEQWQAEAKEHNTNLNAEEIATQTRVKASRIQKVIDWANKMGVKLNFEAYTTTGNAGTGQLTNAQVYADRREMTISKLMLSEGLDIAWVAGHELTHQVRENGTKQDWEAYKATIKTMLGEEAWNKGILQRAMLYRQAYKNMNDADFLDAMEEELCADVAGDIFTNTNNINKVLGIAQSWPQRLLNTIVDTLRTMFGNGAPRKYRDALSAWEKLAKEKAQAEGNGNITNAEPKHSIVGVEGEHAVSEDVAREEQVVRHSISNSEGSQLEETESAVRYSIVTDPQLIAELEASPKRMGYRNVVQREDGLFEAPMGNSLRGNGITVENTPFAMGQWEQSEEHPELVYGDNKITLVKPDGKTVADVNYNPYIHNRLNTLNAQFKQAWERPDLVYVETEVPETDLEGGYMAEHAHLSTGVHQWSNGALMLSRYDKPVRIVPWDEVAIPWIEKYKKSGVHFDIVPPALRPILTEAGVKILPPHKGMGENCFEAYEEWKAEQELAEGKEIIGQKTEGKYSVTNKNNQFNEHTNEEKNVSLQQKTREYEHDQVARLSGEGDAISTLHRTTSPDSGTDNRAAEKVRPSGGQKESLLGSLVRRAKEDETWIKDIRPLVGRFISSAGEHEVFFSRKGDTVIKLNDFEYLPENSTDFTSFINRIESFNELFPDVAVTVVGYTYNSEGKVSVVLEQPVVDAEREATEAEIDAFMEDHDFYMDMSGEYTDGRYVVYDLKPNNVYVDKSGSLRFFDALVFDESRAGSMLTIPHDIKKRKKFVAPYQEVIQAKERLESNGAVKEAIGIGDRKFSLPNRNQEIFAEEQGVIDAAKANGTYLKAPNGNPTNLNEKQWAQVRTKAFKKWFGDWENDPENSSKVVDENGEPMVVYHATDWKPLEQEKGKAVFSKDKAGENTDFSATDWNYAQTAHTGHWFNESKDNVEKILGDNSAIAAFLNLREIQEYERLKDMADEMHYFESGEELAEDYENNGYDGFKVKDEEFGGYSYVAFSPTQIKSATENNGEFSEENGDIRYSIRLSSSNKAVAAYDKANGTDVVGFFKYLRNGKKAEKGEPNVFHIGNAGELLEQFGIKGKFMVGAFTFSATHTDNEDHNLGVKEWVDVINNLNNPLAITSYKGFPNEFRIYTNAIINGKNICVGIKVSVQDGEIKLSRIISAYGRDINKLFGAEKTNLLYPATINELKRKISQGSTTHNSWLNATSTAYVDKGMENSANTQTKADQSSQSPQNVTPTGQNGANYSIYGGNKGYVGYSMSKRAANARAEGRFPKGDFKKEYNITDASLDMLTQAGVISNSEWHHTSMYGNKTHFYGWGEDGFAEHYAENKAEIDKLARQLSKSKPNIEEFEPTTEGMRLYDKAKQEWKEQRDAVVNDWQDKFYEASEQWKQQEEEQKAKAHEEWLEQTEYNNYVRDLNVPAEFNASNGVRVVTNGSALPAKWEYYWGENPAFKKYANAAREELEKHLKENKGEVPTFEEWKNQKEQTLFSISTPPRQANESIIDYAHRVAQDIEKKRKAQALGRGIANLEDDIELTTEHLRIIGDNEPHTIDEAAATALAGTKLLWEDYTDGEKVLKGAKSMLGWGEGERKRYFNMFASKENGGVSVEQMGEAVIEICSQYNIPVDETEDLALSYMGSKPLVLGMTKRGIGQHCPITLPLL